MSGSYNYYLGPYVETRSPIGPVDRTVDGCSNVACEVHTRSLPVAGKFCTNCGAARGPVVWQEIDETVAPPIAEIDEYLTDWNIGEALRAWTPNRPGAERAPREFHIDPEANGALPFNDMADSAAAEMAWLMRAYGREVTALQAAYGPGGVSIRWGLVWMWM